MGPFHIGCWSSATSYFTFTIWKFLAAGDFNCAGPCILLLMMDGSWRRIYSCFQLTQGLYFKLLKCSYGVNHQQLATCSPSLPRLFLQMNRWLKKNSFYRNCMALKIFLEWYFVFCLCKIWYFDFFSVYAI